MELRKMRERLGMTQTQLAEKLRVSQVTVSRWETDAMTIQHPEILRLAMEHLRCASGGVRPKSGAGKRGAPTSGVSRLRSTRAAKR